MAVRPVFVAQASKPYVTTESTAFTYYSGFALSQKQKCIDSLHSSFISQNQGFEGLLLEISTKSNQPLGVCLSAFHLLYGCRDGHKRPVENVFQSSKCFSNGKQYQEILDLPAAEAKRFAALRTSGDVVLFRLEGTEFPTEPRTFFYDWLYINALCQNQELANEVIRYRAFTDIEFNPVKSINCQAKAAAVFVGLHESGRLQDAISSPEMFLKAVFDER